MSGKNDFIKALLTVGFIVWGISPGCAMEDGDDDQPRNSVSKLLIDGEVGKGKPTVIKNLLNNMYINNDFVNLSKHINLLSNLGEEINPSDVLINLFRKIKHHYSIGKNSIVINNYITCFQNIENIIRNITVDCLKRTAVDWAAQELDDFHNVFSISGYLSNHPTDTIAYLWKFFKIALADELTSHTNSYKIGTILYIYPELRKECKPYLEAFLRDIHGLFPNNSEEIIASFCLNTLQPNDSDSDYISRLNLTFTDLHSWIRKNEKALEKYNIHLPYYGYTYIIDRFKEQCSMEDYMRRDFFLSKVNGRHDYYFSFSSDYKSKLVSSTFDIFDPKELLEFYKLYSEKSEEEKFIFFSLLCQKQLMNTLHMDDFCISLTILEYFMQSFLKTTFHSIGEEQRDKFFDAVYRKSYSRKNINFNDYHRLGKLAYNIFQKHKKWEELTKRLENYQDKYLDTAEYCFNNALENIITLEDEHSSILPEIYYYLSIINSIFNNTEKHKGNNRLEKAKEYMNLAHFWDDQTHQDKILELRRIIAESSFTNEDYAEVLHQYTEIERLEVLSKKDSAMKLLCLNKLGYEQATNQQYDLIISDKIDDETIIASNDYSFLSKLISKLIQRKDYESVSLLYKLMKQVIIYDESEAMQYEAAMRERDCDNLLLRSFSPSYNNYLEIMGSTPAYLLAQYKLSNFRNVLVEAESLLKSPSYILSKETFPCLMLSCAKLDEMDQFKRYLAIYMQEAEKVISDMEFIKQYNSSLISSMCSDPDIKKEFIMEAVNHLSNLPLYFSDHICVAEIFSSHNEPDKAYDSLVKAVKFNPKAKSVQLITSDQNLLSAHNVLKIKFPIILNLLIQLNKEEDAISFVNYLKKKHNITVKIKKKNNKKSNKKKSTIYDIRAHLLQLFDEQAGKSYKQLGGFIEKLKSITPDEWEKLNHQIRFSEFWENINNLTNQCEQNRRLLERMVADPSTDIPLARTTLENFQGSVSQINHMALQPLKEITSQRKKKKHQELLKKNYQVDEESFLEAHSHPLVSKKLLEIQSDKEKALLNVKEQIRLQRDKARRILQEKYQQNQEKEKDRELDISPDTLLISYGMLPSMSIDYTQDHNILLFNIVSKKYSLTENNQEVLRIILTGGERAFQITSMDIKKLFSQFPEVIRNIHHGGSHEKISGMGLTLMPNADGIKKGSYHGQLTQTKEKIITLIANKLTAQDLIEESHE